jgi:hypothetical protein
MSSPYKYPRFLLRRVAVHTTGPVYFQEYRSAQETFNAYKRAQDAGDSVDYLTYMYPDPEEFSENKGLYYGHHDYYSVPYDMIINCRDSEP